MTVLRAITIVWLLCIEIVSSASASDAMAPGDDGTPIYRWPPLAVESKRSYPAGLGAIVPNGSESLGHGRLFVIPALGALFFHNRDDLLHFENGEINSSQAIFLPGFHVVRATSVFHRTSIGGSIEDPQFGSGHILIFQNSISKEELMSDLTINIPKPLPFIRRRYNKKEVNKKALEDRYRSLHDF